MTSGNALPGLGWNFSYAIAYRQSGIGLDYFSMNADRKGSFETTPAKLIADNDWVLLSTTGSNAWNYSSGVTNYTGIRFFRSFGFGAETQHNVNFSIGIGQCRERNLSTHLVAGKYHEGWFIGGYWDHSLERAESGRKSFGVMPGVEINLHVADHWALHAEAGILYAKMPAVDFYYRYYQGSSTHYESYILNIPSHHLTAGFLNAGITLSIRH